MNTELVKFDTVQKGLEELANTAYTISQNLKERISAPILKDGTNLWDTWLDSRTIQLYGGVNEDNRHKFKIDNEFDLSKIVNADISSDGSIGILIKDYLNSKGTEFIIVKKSELKGADSDYAIRSDKYNKIKDQLNNSKIRKNKFEEYGGFKINNFLTQEEAEKSDGWIELAVGKNKANKNEYESAVSLLKKYISKADENNCFRSEGMGIYIETESKDYKARPWCVNISSSLSIADAWNNLIGIGRFLRVRQDSVAEGDSAQKINPDFAEAYNSMLNGENILHTPKGDYVLAKGKIIK